MSCGSSSGDDFDFCHIKRHSGKRLKDFAKYPAGVGSRKHDGGAFGLAGEVGLALGNTSPDARLLGGGGHKI
jgi:hypothetical protein